MRRLLSVCLLSTLCFTGCAETSPHGRFTKSKAEVVESKIVKIEYNAFGLAFVNVEYDGYYGDFNTYAIPPKTLKEGDIIKSNMVTYMDDQDNIATVVFKPLN
ncbi:MAG: hypothetical protein ACRC1P_09775 [Cellulosilyticaceae bacterium]